jgi:hypothetical protein
MTKQEEIRKGLYELLRDHVGASWFSYVGDEVIKYLHSQGVVIQTGEVEHEIYDGVLHYNRETFPVIEPLIEGEK